MDSAELAKFSPEYRARLERLLREQQIAQTISQRAMRGPQIQQSGPIASQISPFAALANVLESGIGAYAGNRASKKLASTRQEAAASTQAALDSFNTSEDKIGTVNSQLNSQDPIVAAKAREIADTMAKARKDAEDREFKRTQTGAEILGKDDPVAAIAALRSGKLPTDLAPPVYKEPEVKFITTPDGKTIPQQINYDAKGRPTASLGSAGSVTNVNLPNQEGAARIEQEQKDIGEYKTKAQTAQQALATASRISNLLRDGAQAGGGETIKQNARKALSFFNIDLPETGMTDELRSQLGKALLANAKSLGTNPTNTDAERIDKIVGTIDTDPMALVNMQALIEAQARKALYDFDTVVGIKRKNADPRISSLYDTIDVGVSAPSLEGATFAKRILIAQNMIQEGVPKEVVAGIVGLKPEEMPTPEAETRFDLDSVVGKANFPLGKKPASATPAAKPRWKPIDQMTEAEKREELRRLRGGN